MADSMGHGGSIRWYQDSGLEPSSCEALSMRHFAVGHHCYARSFACTMQFAAEGELS